MITSYKFNNMIIENNRITFKNFEKFELCNNQLVFPIEINEIQFNLMDDDFECVLYINNQIEISRFVIDDINITKDISIINNLKEIKLIEIITILFHYNNSLFKMIIRTNLNEEKKIPLKEEKLELESIINPISILENNEVTIFVTPKDEGVVYVDEDDFFIDENEKANIQTKTFIFNDDIMRDVGSDINFDEDFDDLI